MSAIRTGLYNLINVSGVTSLLASAPAGRSTSIFHEEAPDNAVPAWVIYDKVTGRPDNLAMKDAHDQNDIWQVVGVAKGDADKAERIAAAIYTAVHDKPISISGMTPLWLRREMDIDFWQTVEGDRWDYTGFQFRLVAT